MNTHKPLLSWYWWLHEYTQATIVMILMTTWIHTSHYCHDTDDNMNTHKPLLSWYWWLHEYTQATIVMRLVTTWIHTSHYCHDTDDCQFPSCERRVWKYNRGNQNRPPIDEEQTTQWSKEKVQKDKQDLQNIHIKLKIEKHEHNRGELGYHIVSGQYNHGRSAM
jgi:hypothetical protein